jgi:hypothetical protein
MLARTHCKRNHAFAEFGIWKPNLNHGKGARLCRACVRLRKRGRSKSRQSGVVLETSSIRSQAAILAWQTKKARNGGDGISAETRAAMAERLRERLKTDGHPMGRRTACVHGHAYTTANTAINSRGARECLTCRAFRKHARTLERMRDEVQRVAMGGQSSAAFQRATRRLESYLDVVKRDRARVAGLSDNPVGQISCEPSNL